MSLLMMHPCTLMLEETVIEKPEHFKRCWWYVKN